MTQEEIEARPDIEALAEAMFDHYCTDFMGEEVCNAQYGGIPVWKLPPGVESALECPEHLRDDYRAHAKAAIEHLGTDKLKEAAREVLRLVPEWREAREALSRCNSQKECDEAYDDEERTGKELDIALQRLKELAG